MLLSESDAISYLFTGRPSFAVTTAADRSSSQAASVLLPTLGSALGDRVARALGFDQFQIETAGGEILHCRCGAVLWCRHLDCV